MCSWQWPTVAAAAAVKATLFRDDTRKPDVADEKKNVQQPRASKTHSPTQQSAVVLHFKRWTDCEIIMSLCIRALKNHI